MYIYIYINQTTRHLNESVEDLQESKYNKILNVSLFYLYFVTFLYTKAVDFEAIKRDLLSGENSSKISNNPPAVCTNTFVVQKHYDYNTSSEIRLSSIEDNEIIRNFRRISK